MALHQTAGTQELVELCGLRIGNIIFKRQTNCCQGDGQVALLCCGNLQSDSLVLVACRQDQWRSSMIGDTGEKVDHIKSSICPGLKSTEKCYFIILEVEIMLVASRHV
jgi:hypothetical protein